MRQTAGGLRRQSNDDWDTEYSGWEVNPLRPRVEGNESLGSSYLYGYTGRSELYEMELAQRYLGVLSLLTLKRKIK